MPGFPTLTAALLALGTVDAARGTGPEADQWVLLSWLESEVPGVLDADLDRGVREAARYRLGVELLSQEELFVEGGGEVQQALARCAADVGCLAGALAPTRADAALLLVAKEAGGRSVLALRAVDLRSLEIRHQAVRPVSSEHDPRDLARELAAETFERLGYEEGGLLTVHVEPPDAELLLAGPLGERAAAGGRSLLLRPGLYELRASRDGYVDATRALRVEARQSAKLELTLQGSDSILESPWLWAGIGAAALAVGVGVAVSMSSGDRCFCAAPDPASCQACP